MQAIGDNMLVETAASGTPQVGAAGEEGRGSLRGGMLEGSNVNVVEELVDMIETQRAYEVNSKMIQRSEEHTSELQSLMRISYAVFCLKKKKKTKIIQCDINETLN